MKSEQKQKAKELFFNSSKSYTQIAEEIDIDPKTLYRWVKNEAWDKFKQAALVAPAIAVENMFTQILKLQKNIAGRPADKQFPTLQEAEITRKLTSCITQMNKYLAMGMNMKIADRFGDYIWDRDPAETMNLVRYADDFFYDERQEAEVFPWQELHNNDQYQQPSHQQDATDDDDDFEEEDNFEDEFEDDEDFEETGNFEDEFEDEEDNLNLKKESGILNEEDNKTLNQQASQPKDTENMIGQKSGIFGHFENSATQIPASHTPAEAEKIKAEIAVIHQRWQKMLDEHEQESKTRKAS